MAKFNEVLSAFMFEADITSEKLATDINVATRSVNRWKTGESGIALSLLIKICKYFNCSLDYLVGLTESNIKPDKFEIENFGKQVREIRKERAYHHTLYEEKHNSQVGTFTIGIKALSQS